MSEILQTQRLLLRQFNLQDADFILQLLNTPNWLKFIGDKGVRTREDAIEYLENGPIKSYNENGFGLWLVALKETDTPIGMCGLVNRESLQDIDIGFAFLPEFMHLGYGYEIASATLKYGKEVLDLSKIVAITDPKNIASIKLLTKIGLSFKKTLALSDTDSVALYAT